MALDADVAIVGAGPVGLVLAILLAQRGRSVVILEQWPQRLPAAPRRALRPRGRPHPPVVRHRRRGPAVSEPAEVYEWRNARGHDAAAVRAHRHRRVRAGRSRRCSASPTLEALLEARAVRCPRSTSGAASRSTRSSRTTTTSSSIAASGDPFGLRTSSAATARTRRCATCSASTMDDRGFFYDWLIVDVILDEPRVFDPINLQICDPTAPDDRGVGRPRPPTLGVHAPARRTARGAATRRPPPGSCSRRGTCTPATRGSNATRSTRSRPASPTRGRSDAPSSPATPRTRCRRSRARACAAGIRDAANLAWKLDLVLTGRAGTGAARDVRRRAAAERGRRHRVLHRARQGHLRARPGRGHGTGRGDGRRGHRRGLRGGRPARDRKSVSSAPSSQLCGRAVPAGRTSAGGGSTTSTVPAGASSRSTPTRPISMRHSSTGSARSAAP